jgi:hypothetical protein
MAAFAQGVGEQQRKAAAMPLARRLLALPLDAGREALLFVIVGGLQAGAEISLSTNAATGSRIIRLQVTIQ